MARRPDTTAATETLHEIESVFDRAAGWAGRNPARFLTGLGVVLAIAAAVGLYDWLRVRGEKEASGDVAIVRAEYLEALGAPAGSLEVAEPANPEITKQVRTQYIERFLKVADDHSGSAAAVLARLEAGNLQVLEGNLEGARETFEAGANDAPPGELRALALRRLARALEDLGQWEEAAQRHEQAAAIEQYPLRYLALADAARCYAEAGNRERAVALFDRVQAEAPNARLAPHVRARLSELDGSGS